MSTLKEKRAAVTAPLRLHPVCIANDLQWIEGTLYAMGNPHDYINQANADFFQVSDARISPWSFTDLPNTHVDEVLVSRDKIQLLVFTAEDTIAQLRNFPHWETVIINLPLAIVRGGVPFFGEAKLHNFMDFWKGLFLPLSQAQVHYLVSGTVELPRQAPLIYVNRQILQSYLRG